DKVYKILVNLLSNAFKFTPDEGEIKVHLSIRSFMDDKDELVIQVMDTGIGIAPEVQEKIFERFYQSIDPEKENSGQGTGIGLHLCKEFVALHGGSVSVDSEPGKGSVFTVTLPVLKAEPNPEIVLSQDASFMKEASLPVNKNKEPSLSERDGSCAEYPTILVIDDNTDFRNFMVSTLQEEYNVLQAPEGGTGWEILLSEIPDLLICDVMMPGINGLELCKRIKTDMRTSHIPVILLTAKSAEESKLEGFEAGADDYICKPFNMDTLLLKIKRLMDLKAQMQKHIIQFSQNGIRLSDVNMNSLDEELIKKAVAYIEEYLSDPQLSVEKISREMGMSRVSFYKKTLAMTGKSPVELIRMIRIKKAGKILEKTRMRVSEVMIEVGINDVKLFRKYFKEEFGVLPSDYQGNKKEDAPD
ncbi:MAG: response regulator, partial [Tannerellaceae bacterium]|nr:response regulator [Tannerellaceae bacterium]